MFGALVGVDSLYLKVFVFLSLLRLGMSFSFNKESVLHISENKENLLEQEKTN